MHKDSPATHGLSYWLLALLCYQGRTIPFIEEIPLYS